MPVVEQAVIVRLQDGSLYVVVVVPGNIWTVQSTSQVETVVLVRQLDGSLGSPPPPPPPPPPSLHPGPMQLVPGGQIGQLSGFGQNGPMQPQIPTQWWLFPGSQLCVQGCPQFDLHVGFGAPVWTVIEGGKPDGGGGGGGIGSVGSLPGGVMVGGMGGHGPGL